MPETYTPVTAVTGTWTEEEIRQQPASWIRSLTNIDNIRSAIDSFLAPLLRKKRSADHTDRGRNISIHWRHHRPLAGKLYR